MPLMSHPMRMGQRRVREHDLAELCKTHDIKVEQLTPEHLRMLTLTSLLVLGGDLDDAVKRYTHALSTASGDAPALLTEIETLLVDAYTHIETYFHENGNVPAFSRHVNTTGERGALLKTHITHIKEIKRIR